MAKDNLGKAVTTRNSYRKANKVNWETTEGKDVSPHSGNSKNQRQTLNKQPGQKNFPGSGLHAAAPRTSPQQRPASNNAVRGNSLVPSSENRASPTQNKTKGKPSPVKALGSLIPQLKPASKVQFDHSGKNSDSQTEQGSADKDSAPSPASNNTMRPHDGGKSKNESMNNVDMWASVMAKLDSMRKEQSEELKGIREEIKITNAGFSHDISQIREEIIEVKSTLQNHESRWESLGAFKQDLVDEVNRQVEQQVASQVAKHLASQAKQLDENIKTQVTSQVVSLKDKLEDSNNEMRDAVLEKADDYLANFTDEVKRDFLKEKRFNRRLNLILMGLPELQEVGGGDDDEEVRVTTLLKERLSLNTLKIDAVYRLGQKGKGKRPRPIMMEFSKTSRRKAVWFSKSKLNEKQDIKLRLQEDIPPPS